MTSPERLTAAAPPAAIAADGPARPASAPDPGEALRQRARTLVQALRQGPDALLLADARSLLQTLCDHRAFDAMLPLAEQLGRIDPADARSRRLYAQALIDTGMPSAAIDLLRQLLASLPRQHDELAEAWGLLGRAHKQIFFETPNPVSPASRWALAAAVAAYQVPYKADPARHTWHGVNLLALVSRARLEGWTEIAPKLNTAKLAAQLKASLDAVPEAQRDRWHLPTRVEVALGAGLASGDLTETEALLAQYLRAPDVPAFLVASTLRQFTEVWGLDQLRGAGPRGDARSAALRQRARGLVDVLRARLLQLPGGGVVMSGQHLAQLAGAGPGPGGLSLAPRPAARGGAAGLHTAPAGVQGAAGATDAVDATDAARDNPSAPSTGQLEAILGAEGPQTFAWWQAGMQAARSVGIVRSRMGKRLGTGFLVRAADLGLAPADALLVLTNFHVVNPDGLEPGIRPEDAELVFEAVDANTAHAVDALLWASPVDQHDAALLRLKTLPPGVPGLPLGRQLPALPPPDEKKRPRVYIIGYPGGRALSFAFQDNELLDHEGAPHGKPQIDGVCRVHYRTPTEGGNSGSPVFDDSNWRVIALHHKGGKFGMPRLNGQPGSYAANEGLAMATLVQAARQALAVPATAPG